MNVPFGSLTLATARQPLCIGLAVTGKFEASKSSPWATWFRFLSKHYAVIQT